MHRYFFPILIYLSCANALADAHETGKITRLQIEGDNLVMVWLDGADDTSECSTGSYWTVHSNDALFKEKLSMLLASQATQKEVKLRHLSSWGCGVWNSNKIYSIQG